MKTVKDHYFHKAKKDRYVARSVYKLMEIDKSQNLLRDVGSVLDLGSSPGSWLQYILENTGRDCRVVCIDLKCLKIQLPKRVEFILGDIYEVFSANHDQSDRHGFFDCVLSDMAPATTGIRDVDTHASLALCRQVLAIGRLHLKPCGNLLMKVFQGKGYETLITSMRQDFKTVRVLKPEGCRAESREIYLLGKHKKPVPCLLETPDV